MSEWETVVGLEVHVELATKTKLFSHAPNRFGDAPNTNITPVCLGLPGSLPVLNRRAVELAMTVGLALGCEIKPSVFHRKNYFYPDMPKDYQVSQYDRPICVDGILDLPNGTRVGIERAHLEEDAGKTTHIGGDDGRIHGAEEALVDYNRAGVPLLEVVSRPDIRSAEDARAYVEELRAILIATQASEARL
ncbi:MAG: Asp-tRNA(Asn)/Glu-tRNA(Gln) amidotransferase subunit GatB, partial [Acidimicrobiales bacterium]|nr:Asp-tRNA(Asn)/Glu-tRNA(Gln) amidotransferase subunit GatB [Acidimicrobiales bacterium]